MGAIDYSQIYKDLVDHLLELRKQRDISEAVMLLAILDVESDQEQMQALALAGCENLERFVRRLEIVDVARFRSFRVGVDKIGRDAALRIGAEATIESSKTLTQASTTLYVQACDAQIESRRGVLPTRETAQTLRRQVAPIPEMPRALKNKTAARVAEERVAQLESENAKLRAQIAKLTTERDAAVRRAADLSKQLTQMKRKHR